MIEQIIPQLEDRKFGRLKVLRFSHTVAPCRRFWACLCNCGRERILREDYIKTGEVTCAECRRRELASRRDNPRRCPACKHVLPTSCFSKDRSTTAGQAIYCKECARSKAAKLRMRRKRRRPGDVEIPETKQCNVCKLTKSAEEFWTDRTQLDSLSTKCSECSNYSLRRHYQKIGKKQRQERGTRFYRYGLSKPEAEQMLEQQGYVCAVCRRPIGSEAYVVDHDHTVKGRAGVRGLLCSRCNTGLGQFGDDPKLLRTAAGYLESA